MGCGSVQAGQYYWPIRQAAVSNNVFFLRYSSARPIAPSSVALGHIAWRHGQSKSFCLELFTLRCIKPPNAIWNDLLKAVSSRFVKPDLMWFLAIYTAKELLSFNLDSFTKSLILAASLSKAIAGDTKRTREAPLYPPPLVPSSNIYSVSPSHKENVTFHSDLQPGLLLRRSAGC